VAIFPKGKLPQLTIPVIQAQNAHQNKASKKFLGMQKLFPYGIISKQVFRLTSYKADSLAFLPLPSQFPNDRLSPTGTKTFDVYGDSYRHGF
jgi:hypothetical protein